MKRTLSMLVVLSLFGFATGAGAATLYWDGTDSTADADGGNGTWDNGTTSNWDDAATAGNNATWSNANPDSAVFGGTAGTVTLGGAITAGTLTFNTASYVLDLGANALTFTSLAGSSLSSITINGTGGSLVKSGSGDVTLYGNNGYTGGTTISGGILRAYGSNTAFGTGTISVTGNATLATASGGGARALANAITISGTNTLYLDGGYANLTLNGSITGSGTTLSKTSTGTVTLGGTVNMGTTTGTVSNNTSGNLVFASGAAVTANAIAMSSNSASNIITIESGATVTTRYINLGNGSSTSGRINQTGGTVTVNSGGNGFRVGHWGNGTEVSKYNLSGGTLDTTAVTATVSWDGAGDVTVGGGAGTATWKVGQLNWDGGGADTNLGTVTVSPNGTLETYGNIGAVTAATEGIYLNGGIISTAGATTSRTWANRFFNNGANNTTFSIASGHTATISGIISGSGAGTLIKTGDGTLKITTRGTYTGATTVNGGILELATPNYGRALTTSGITVNTGATLNINGTNILYDTGSPNVYIPITVNAGTVALISTAGGSHNHFGALTLNGGTIWGKSTSPYSNQYSSFDADITVGGSATSTIKGDNASFHFGLANGNRTFTVASTGDASGVDLLVSANLGDAGGLIKDGAGTMRLSGSNTYAGATSVVAGVLDVTGSVASQVTASNSGTKVTGGGTFGGGLIMGAGTTHAPGASPGAPIVTGTLEYNASTLVVDIWTNLNGVDATPGTHFDQITINGATPTLTLLNAPNIVVDLNNLYNPALGNSYVIITGFNNTVTSGFNSTVTVNNGASFVSAGKSFQIDYNTGNIALTVIPEPATFGLLLAFGAAAVIRRRRIG